MRGTKEVSRGIEEPIKLTSTEEGGGPIHMLVTELAPDTILINEVEEGSGKILLTASLSIVEGTGANSKELVQISHEVGEVGKTSIEGHQVWRLSQAPIEFDDFDVRGTTGR